MDAVLIAIILGCAIAGIVWGAVRMATLAVAIVAATLAGRWAGPMLAQLLQSEGGMKDGAGPAGVGLAAVVALVLVFIAGRGVRKGLEKLHLGWLDRIAGAAFAAFGAAVVVAILLGLMAQGGHPPSTSLATKLSVAGQAALAVHTWPSSKAIPSSTPASATKSGQQPR